MDKETKQAIKDTLYAGTLISSIFFIIGFIYSESICHFIGLGLIAFTVYLSYGVYKS